MKIVITDINGAPTPVGAYSPAVIHNGVIYCAGQIGLDPETGQLVSGGIEAQAMRVMDNLLAVLLACGSSPQNILMTTIFLANISDAKIVNEIYTKFLYLDVVDGNVVNGDVGRLHFPARQTLAVKELPLGALIEVSLIAAVDVNSEG